MNKTTVTSLTAERMIEIEQASIVSGRISGDDLVLTTKSGEDVVAGNVRGFQGRVGKTGNSFWTTTMTLTLDVTENVVPENIPDNELQVGDLILSRSPSSMGFISKVVSITSEDNATVLYLGNLRGPGGGSQEDFDRMFEDAIDGWSNSSTMTQPDATSGNSSSGLLISPKVFREAVLSLVTGSVSTLVSAVGQALNKAKDAKEARDIIGAASKEDLESKIESVDIKNVVRLTQAQYNALTTKDAKTFYLIRG